MYYQRISHLFVQQLQSSIIEDQNLYNDVERCDVGKSIGIVRLKSIHISLVRSLCNDQAHLSPILQST